MSFAAPLFLLAALAGAIPVLLHMINRRQTTVVPFSTLRFLRQSARRTRRRKRIHDLLLLLLRVAALMLVAIALARPTIHHVSGLLGLGSARAVVLIMDNSASMATKDEAGSRWEAALAVSEQLLDCLSEQDSVALLFSSGPARPKGNRLHQNHEVVHQALAASRVRYERADLGGQLQAARELLQAAETPNKEIYIMTDMQAVSWEALEADAEFDQKSDLSGKPSPRDTPDDLPVVVVNVHGRPLPNVSLGPIELHSAAPITGAPVRATITVQGDSKVAQQNHVELYLGGQKQAISSTLAIDAGETTVQTFRFSPDKSGVLRGEFRLLEKDSNSLDNRRFFALVVDPQVPVAIVQARGHAIEYLEDAYYLKRALSPGRQGARAIRPASLVPPQLLTERLSKFAVLFCVNLPSLDSSTARRLRDYVIDGGHVVWTCGDQVDPARYNAMNAQADDQLLPARLEKVRELPPDRTDPPRIGWLDGQHSALASLIEPASLYQSVLVYRHLSISLVQGSDARVLARLTGGEPLLVERSVGAGSVLLWATSLQVDWTNFPLRPLFLPFLSRMTLSMAGTQTSQTQLVAGTRLVIPLSGETESTVELTRPSGETVSIGLGSGLEFSSGASNSRDRLTSDNPIPDLTPYDVGVYQVRVLGAGRTRQMAFACNLDPAELDPSMLDREQLEARLGPRNLVFCDKPADLIRHMARLREGKSLREPLLVVVLIALVAESLVANRRVAAAAAGRPPRKRTEDWIERFRQKPDVIGIP